MDWEPPDGQDSPRTVVVVPTTTEVFTRANAMRACVATKALCFNVREYAYHAHSSVNNGVMPFRPASRVCIPLGERGLKAMCLYVGLVHQVDAILIAQLIPAAPCVIQAPLLLLNQTATQHESSAAPCSNMSVFSTTVVAQLLSMKTMQLQVGMYDIKH